MNRMDLIYSYDNSVIMYDFEISRLKPDDPNMINEVQELNNKISNDINEMSLIVQTLDPDHTKKDEILAIVIKNLSGLGAEMGSMSRVLGDALQQTHFTEAQKDKIKDEMYRVDDIYNMIKHNTNALFKVREYMQDFKFAKKESEIKNINEIQAANLSLQSEKSEKSEKSSAIDSVYGFFSDLFTSEPEIRGVSLSKYIGEKHVDEKKTIEDVTNLMKNKEYGKMVMFKNSSGEIILNEDHIGFMAPEVFVKDILRSDLFKLNGKIFFERTYDVGDDYDKAWFKYKSIPNQSQGNPNEIVKEMCNLFGTKGANRLFKVCFQGIAANLQKIIVNKTLKGGEYEKALPDRQLVFINETGTTFDIECDNKGNVSLTVKYLVRLHTEYESFSDFTAHIPVKVKITMPLESLWDNMFDYKTGKQLGIHVEESLGKLILNDRRLAVEVLDKL
jgi:hypothetical protein